MPGEVFKRPRERDVICVVEPEWAEIGEHLVNLSAVASAHWHDGRLYVNLLGGRFLRLESEDGQRLWAAIERSADATAGG